MISPSYGSHTIFVIVIVIIIIIIAIIIHSDCYRTVCKAYVYYVMYEVLHHNIFKGCFITIMHKPLRRGLPLYEGQTARPQSVLSSEILL